MQKKEEILSWLDKQIETVSRFEKGGESIGFQDIKTLSKEWQDIAEGCKVRVIDREDNCITLECHMEESAGLKIHKHPDFYETFTVESGVLFDKVNNVILNKKRGSYTFQSNIWHHIICIEKCEMKIECKIKL